MQKIVPKVEQEHGRAQRIWVMDRGNTSEANLAFIRQRGGPYIVGTAQVHMGRFAGEITTEGWQEVRSGIAGKVVDDPAADGIGARYILCRSRERAAKEQSMADRFEVRMETGLQALATAARQGRLRDEAEAHRRLGRLQERNRRAGGLFSVQIVRNAAGRLTVRWSKPPDRQVWREPRCGCYVLRTNIVAADPVELWQCYRQLAEAEWVFRLTKDELEIRPIWHQTAQRVQTHILVCFLAYAMWKTLAGWMKLSGWGDAPRALVEELRTIHSADVVLQTRVDNQPGPELTVRCVPRPDQHQEALLDRLGLERPNQSKRFRNSLVNLPQQAAPVVAAPR